jgi:WD40 repeat protein
MRTFWLVGLWCLLPPAAWAQTPADTTPGVQLAHLWQGQGEKARQEMQLSRAAHAFAQAAQAYRRAGDASRARAALQEAERLLPPAEQTIAVKERITLAAVDRAEKQLVVVNNTNQVVVWDLEKGEVRRTLTIPLERDDFFHRVRGGACSRDGSRLVIFGGHRLFQVWDLTTGKQVPGFGKVRYDIESVSFSPDEKHLVAWDSRFIQVWDSRSGKTVHLINAFAKDHPWRPWPSPRTHGVVAPGAKRMLVFGEEDLEQLLDIEKLPPKVRARVQALRDQQPVAAQLLDIERGPLLDLDRKSFRQEQVHFTPDGSKVVAAGRDGRVRVWDAKDGKQLHDLDFGAKAGATGVVRLHLTRDGRCLGVPASAKVAARLWDLTKGTVLREYPAPANGAIAFNADETLFFSSGGGEVGVWETQTGKKRWSVRLPGTLPTRARFVAQGRKVVAWDEARAPLLARPVQFTTTTVWTWDARDGKLLHQGPTPPGTEKVRVLENGLCLMDRRVTDPKHSHSLLQIRPAEALQAGNAPRPALTLSAGTPLQGALCSPDEKTLITWGPDASVQLWDLQGKRLRSLKAGLDVRNALFTGDSGVAAWSNDKIVRHWDLKTGKEQKFRLDGEVQGVHANGAGTRLLTWDKDYNLAWWDLTTGKRLHSFAHRRAILGVAFDPAREAALSWSLDGTARVWDLNKGKEQAVFQHDGPVEFAAWGPGGQVLTCQGSVVRVWKEGAAQPAHTLEQAGAEGAQWGRDGKKLLTWGWEPDVKWWTLGAQPTFKSFPAWVRRTENPGQQGFAGGTVRAWALLDDRRILTLNSEDVAALWDTGTGKQVARYKDSLGPYHRIHNYFGGSVKRMREAMAVSPDGRLFLKWDIAVSVRDAETGQLLARFLHSAPVWGVQFLRGGSRVLVWGENGDVRLWDLPRLTPKSARPEEELLLRLELQTRQRLDPAGRLVPLSGRELRDREEALRKLRAQGNKAKG